MTTHLILAAASVLLLSAALIGLALVVADSLPLVWHKRAAVSAFSCFLLALLARWLS